MPDRPEPDQIWRMEDDAKTNYTLDKMCEENQDIGVRNFDDIYKAERTFRRDGVGFEKIPLPSGFVKPIVVFPSSGFAPDYFSLGVFFFCSERLRDALAQPPEVIDCSPIEFRCTGAKAIAQNYQRMRVIAMQPGMDLHRSEYDTFDWGDPEMGVSAVAIHGIDKLVLQEGFQPKTEVFYLTESTLCLLAQDSLAGRVLRANCTGIEFRHLDTLWLTSGRTITVRTKWGTRQRA